MGIKFSAIYLVLLAITIGIERDIYQEIRVFDPQPATLRTMHELGIPLDHVRFVKGQYIDLVARDDQVEELLARGISLAVLVEDMGRRAAKRSVPAVSRVFPLGSMLGNYTFSEAVARMDSLAARYPQLIAPRQSIGQSVEGRDIWAFKVSDNPDRDEDEPEVLFTGLTHAREPLGMMNLFYYVQTLCENYGTDAEATFLINNREMWFVPVLNPDGYVYNEDIWNTYHRPGYQRKNRRDTGCGKGTQQGIDLNRNYAFDWGADSIGSSPFPCSETFRGDSAFSEPETDALRRFVSAHDFKNILHYHSYGNVLIHSYGDGSYPAEPDLTTLREIGAEMTRENEYPVGTGVELIGYPVNGDAVDWSFGSMGLLSYTPEVGSFQDNFWPPENRVLPLCQSQYYQNKVFSFVAGSDPLLYDYRLPARVPAPMDTVSFTLIIKNRGLSPTNGPVSVLVTPLDSLIVILTARDTLPGLPGRTTGTLEVALSVSPLAPAWTRSGFSVMIQDSLSFPRSDTVRFLIGTSDYLYGDLVADGVLDIYDILKLADIILQFTEASEYQMIVADIIPDGTVNINDLLALVDMIMGY